jgi:hypothetical protein
MLVVRKGSEDRRGVVYKSGNGLEKHETAVAKYKAFLSKSLNRRHGGGWHDAGVTLRWFPRRQQKNVALCSSAFTIIQFNPRILESTSIANSKYAGFHDNCQPSGTC